MNSPLSIVIPVLNDQEELTETINSIRKTAGNDVEVIVVDDQSETPVVLYDRQAILKRNDTRIGAGASKHVGATMASNPYVLLLDSHMRFEEGWLDKALTRIVGRPNTIHCGACLGLDASGMDVTKPRGVYCGATLCLYNPKNGEIFEGKWMPEKKDEDDYEIPCLMGASYFVPKELFLRLRGMAALKMWGSEEPYLSIKAWLSGAEVRMMKSVRIGHKFRSAAPYITGVPYLVYNKFWALRTLMDPILAEYLIGKFPQNGDTGEAAKLIAVDEPKLIEHQAYYRNMFIRDIYWYCDRFGIDVPDTTK